jgi:hypothetical protein
VRDPQAIIDRFRPEFEKLVHAVLLAPWDEEADPEISRAFAGRDRGAGAGRRAPAAAWRGQRRGRRNVAGRRADAAPALDGAAAVAMPPTAADVDLQMPFRRRRARGGLRKRKSAFAAARATRH